MILNVFLMKAFNYGKAQALLGDVYWYHPEEKKLLDKLFQDFETADDMAIALGEQSERGHFARAILSNNVHHIGKGLEWYLRDVPIDVIHQVS